MKHIFRVWSTWWFATMVPVYTPLTTLAARERLRKRRLQSIILLFALLITLLMVVLYSLNMSILLMLFGLPKASCSFLRSGSTNGSIWNLLA